MTASDENSPARSGDRVRILLVDDDERWARATSRLLEVEDERFVVETAHSLSDGQSRFADLDPDCIVCDYQLGDGNGLDMLETVRERDPDRPFVLVTGRGSESVASDAINRGVTDYIPKSHDDEGDLLASRIDAAVRSYRTERALERERRRKDAMLDILTDTTAESTLSQQFCARLVDSRGYECAWVAQSTADGLVPEAVAGREHYIDDLLDPADGTPLDGTPAQRALDTGESVVRSAVDTDDDWARLATDHGFEAAVAVLIRHDGVRFGVLSVALDDAAVLEQRERRAIEEYADTVGYARSMAEQKRSLMSARPVTIDIELTDPAVPLVGFARALSRTTTLTVRSAVPRDDGTTLYVIDIDGADADALEDAGTVVDAIQSVDVDGEGSPLRCGVVARSPTPEELLAARGGRVAGTTIENETATVSVQIPENSMVSTVRQALETTYDEASVSTIWSGRDRAARPPGPAPLETLTDRQREILRHAVDVGYFELPRGSSATELAEDFGIARATLTQHLRAAQRKLFTQWLP